MNMQIAPGSGSPQLVKVGQFDGAADRLRLDAPVLFSDGTADVPPDRIHCKDELAPVYDLATETCVACPVGKLYVASTDTCICAPGHRTAATDKTQCETCTPGSFAAGAGNVKCTPCLPGRFSSSVAVTSYPGRQQGG